MRSRDTILSTGIRAAMARGQGDRISKLAPATTSRSRRSRGTATIPGSSTRTWRGRRSSSAAGTSEGDGLIRPWVNNLGVPSCSDERFLRTKEIGERNGTGMMVHINRDREEVELAIALFGERPIEHLHRIGALGPGFVAIHAMLTTDREVEMLAEAGAGVAHAPVVCTDILSAVTKVPTMRAAGVVVGLGCDTVINDILKVMRIAFIMHAAETGTRMFDPFGLTTEDVFAMGTIDAARLLRWDHEIGSLEPGKAADVVGRRRRQRAPDARVRPDRDARALRDRAPTWRACSSNGRLVVGGGRVLTIDEPALLDEAERVGACSARCSARGATGPCARCSEMKPSDFPRDARLPRPADAAVPGRGRRLPRLQLRRRDAGAAQPRGRVLARPVRRGCRRARTTWRSTSCGRSSRSRSKVSPGGTTPFAASSSRGSAPARFGRWSQ